MKTRQILMAVGFAGAAWLAIFGDRSVDSEIAEPVAIPSALPPSISAAQPAPASKGVYRSSTRIEAESGFSAGESQTQILALQPRSELIGTTRSGQGGDLFASKSWTPPPVLSKLAPPPPPTAPPLPFTYLGKQTADGQMEVYLARGEEVFVVRDQTVIQNTYRVESIKPPTLSLVYLPLNETQQLSIGVTN